MTRRFLACALSSALTAGCGSEDDARPGTPDASVDSASSIDASSSLDSASSGGSSGSSVGGTAGVGGGTAGVGGGTAGVGGGTAGVGGVASPITPIAALTDEFSNPASAASWTAENVQNVSFEIASTQPGFLTFIAGATPANTGWFQNDEGPLLHRSLSGSFVVMSYVVAGNVNGAASPPTTGFNSAGLLVRDPASTAGDQDWLMHNIGHQGGNSMAGCPNAGMSVGLGSEAKRTLASSSQLCLNPAASHRGRIAICRWGSSFHMLRRLDGESSWSETNVFQHAGMPDQVDVGLIANFWSLPVTVRPQFDWIRSYAVSDASVCSASAFDALFP